MTFVPDYGRRGDRRRFSKLALSAVLLSVLPVVICAALLMTAHSIWVAPRKIGLDALAGDLGLALFGLFALIAGTVFSLLAVGLGTIAIWKISLRPQILDGRRTAWVAVYIGGGWLTLAWGLIATVVGVAKYHSAPHDAAKEKLLDVFNAAVIQAKRSGTFPDTLEQVTSSQIAIHYVYLGRGLPGSYSSYLTPGSQSIVVIYANQSIDGQFAAVCANGMTHEWTKPELDRFIHDSDLIRQSHGISRTAATGLSP